MNGARGNDRLIEATQRTRTSTGSNLKSSKHNFTSRVGLFVFYLKVLNIRKSVYYPIHLITFHPIAVSDLMLFASYERTILHF